MKEVPAGPAIDERRLEALGQAKSATPPVKTPEPKPAEDLAKANEKLSSLLDKPK